MKSAAIRLAVVLGAVAIAGILMLQVYWFSRNLSLSEKEFHQSVSIALLNVAKSMAEYNGSILPSSGLIKRVSSNYYVVNFNDIIDASLLEYYLLEEFGNLGLHTNFEYAIYDCSDDAMVYGNFCNVEDPEVTDASDRKLPKYDEFIYYFGVKFPSHDSFILADMRGAIILSVITVLALIFFIYSIFIMLQQKRLSELQRDFINNMTHEFKTPISSIKLSSDVILESDAVQGDPRLTRYARIIKKQNHRLNQQVEKVLSLAKLDNEKFSLNKELVNLHEMIEEISLSKELEVQKRNIDLELDLQATDPMIRADKFHLSNVLYNLLDNSIKYSKSDTPRIRLSTGQENGNLVFTIRDNGVGIAPEHQRQLFRKFFRVPTGNLHNVKGFGLGLYYVKRIVDQHKWRIAVDSDVGTGTEMTIFIPN
jgi:two-component system phosphate regulon sensor histidine kinase PhoR